MSVALLLELRLKLAIYSYFELEPLLSLLEIVKLKPRLSSLGSKIPMIQEIILY